MVCVLTTGEHSRTLNMGNTADFLPLAVPVSGLTLDNLTKTNVSRDLIEIEVHSSN